MEWDQKKELLRMLHEDWSSCSRCDLCDPKGRRRHNVVFGEGNLDAQVVIVGEAPGHNEDLTGDPFVGKAGKLLDSFLETVGVTRDEVYLLNILGCWPTEEGTPKKTRTPAKTEIKKCLPRVHRTIEIIDPYVLLLLGNVALKALTKEKKGITTYALDDRLPVLAAYTQGLHAEVRRPAFATFHPAALLRNWDQAEDGPLDLSLKTWDRAFRVADKHSQLYKGTTPRFSA